MKYLAHCLLLCSLGLTFSCREPAPAVDIPEPRKMAYGPDSLRMDSVTFHDRVLGALVGSAIGDAMGASTEMWHRDDIQRQYGYITGLTAAVRSQSPEGTWEHNLDAGATTDDTRWKQFLVAYFTSLDEAPQPARFARFITTYYEDVARELGDRELLSNPDLLDSRLEKVDWIREWARVAFAYGEGPEAYQQALNRFYGGEMACAGMLYAPIFGLMAGTTEAAYNMAYDHSLFDHGYAKDITGLVAAMTRMALHTSSMDSILDTAVFVDPYRYQDSRLVGRIPLDLAMASRKTVWLARELPPAPDAALGNAEALRIPEGYPGSTADWTRQTFVYAALEKDKKAIPFHAGEIWQILIAGLEFGEGDFIKTMQFIVNYGRDNDTVAAVAGMILGARVGYSGLPESVRERVISVNREQMGIDLEALAGQLTAANMIHNP